MGAISNKIEGTVLSGIVFPKIVCYNNAQQHFTHSAISGAMEIIIGNTYELLRW